MQPRHIEIVQDTWSDIVPIAGVAADLFYDRLFEIDPGIRTMFENTDLSTQKTKLVQALSATVSALGKPDEVLPALAELGRRHTAYGVRPEHYRSVGQALLETLERGLADRWTADVREAWTAAYTLVAEQMQGGTVSSHERCDRQVA